jgi:hypothetical protein
MDYEEKEDESGEGMRPARDGWRPAKHIFVRARGGQRNVWLDPPRTATGSAFTLLRRDKTVGLLNPLSHRVAVSRSDTE